MNKADIARMKEIRENLAFAREQIAECGNDCEDVVLSMEHIGELLNDVEWLVKHLTAYCLSDTIGSDRVVWRYDPIMLSERYPMEYHIRAFRRLAEELHDYTHRVTISFIDEDYRSVKSNIKKLALLDFPASTQIELGSVLAEIAHHYGLVIDSCAEKIELQQFGIEHARCIDDRLFARLLDCHLNIEKDKTQRLECGCVASIDIGMYNTCRNGCRYCYANYNQNTVAENCAKHNPLAPLISGEIGNDDRINERKIKSCKDNQLRLGDL